MKIELDKEEFKEQDMIQINLEGKTAVICGASKGIGKAIVIDIGDAKTLAPARTGGPGRVKRMADTRFKSGELVGLFLNRCRE